MSWQLPSAPRSQLKLDTVRTQSNEMEDELGQARIRDIPSIAKTLADIESISALKGAYPLLKPLMKMLGVDVAKTDQALSGVDELKARAREMAAIPDRFNEIFSPLGWIIHADMSLEVAREAIDTAEATSPTEAEEILAEYYSPDQVEWMLKRMQPVEAFRPRMRLARLALDDYRAERYHASVPVVLALLDGFVSELHEKRRGFFAKERDMTAWDSIAAHERGLNALADIFQKGRRTLNTEPLTIPYRHGILHGWEMAYDTKLVAAKSWAALLAIREWAIKCERGERDQPEPEPAPSLRGVFEQLRANEETKKKIAAWTPRNLRVGSDIPAHGRPSDYEDGSPERSLVEFFHLWTARNYGFMARHFQLPFLSHGEVTPGEVREVYDATLLRSFRIQEIRDEAPSVAEIAVDLDIEGSDSPRPRTFRLVYFHADMTVVRGDPEGQWGIVHWRL